MDNFDLRKYLAEGKLLKEDVNTILSLLQKNKKDVERHLDRDLDSSSFEVDALGDASVTDEEGYTGYSFRFPEEVDGEFVGENGDEPKPITVGGVDLMYVGYNI